MAKRPNHLYRPKCALDQSLYLKILFFFSEFWNSLT